MGTVTSAGKDKLKIYETVLKSPGMANPCKVVLQLSCQNIVLLSLIIEKGLQIQSEEGGSILNFLSPEQMEQLKAIPSEMLRRGNLTDFYELLKTL